MKTTNNDVQKDLQFLFKTEIKDNKNNNSFKAKMVNKRNDKAIEKHSNVILTKMGYFTEAKKINIRDKLRTKLLNKTTHPT